MAYVILLHLVYLLSSIIGFNLLEAAYIDLVKLSLIVFMIEIWKMIRKSWHYLHDLMNKLIKKFCTLITRIFIRIKAKLLFYLQLVKKQISLDILQLSYDFLCIKSVVFNLQILVLKYKSILDFVTPLLTTLKKLIKHNLNLMHFINRITHSKKIIISIYNIFSYQNDKISKIIKGLSSFKLEKTVELTSGKNDELVMDLKIILEKLEKQSSDIIAMIFDNSLIINFYDIYNYLKNILDNVDQKVSTEMMSIIGQLDIMETINFIKLNRLITMIQLLYKITLIRIDLLLCTMEFYKEIQPTISSLIGSLEFECSNAKEFLSQTSEVEKYIKSTSNQIDDCITKLAGIANKYKIKKFQKLNQALLKLIGSILQLKFYVDLMALEILIFKNIIHTLIEMTVSSAILDTLIKVILAIDSIDKAILTLVGVDVYLRTFYLIQLENSLMIFALSSKLMFSQDIHGYYDVLIINLYWINMLIWAIECYIHHLLVFMYVTKGLNSLIKDIGGQVKIITHLISVGKSIGTITNKLKSIEKSISELNKIQESMDITNWKESAAKIRNETQLINADIEEINSEISEINGYADSIFKSWVILKYLEYFLFVLIIQVHKEIQNTNKEKILGTGIGNKYYTGVMLNVMEPFNKQLMFILWYLLVMWVNLVKLIKVVETAMALIIIETGWLYGLTKILQKHIENINKGVVDVDCAIEGVARNFIKCTLLSANNSIYSNISSLAIGNRVVGMYSVSGVIDYWVLVNRLYDSAKKIDQILKLNFKIYMCRCIWRLETSSWTWITLGPLKVKNIMDKMTRDELDEFLKLDKISEITSLGMSGNHMCLCMVIKYLLYPQMINIIQILASDLQTLSTLSRNLTKYTHSTSQVFQIVKILILVIDILDSISKWVNKNYYVLWRIWTDEGIEIECYCRYYRHPRYYIVVTIILFVSSLIENIWSMDTETLRMSIEKLSILYSQMEIYDLNSTSLKPVCCYPVYSLLVKKECEPKAQGKCCCCWCVACYNIGIILIYLSFQCELCKAICSNKKEVCEKVEKFCELDECTCKCQEPKNGMCCLLNLALSSQVPCSEELQKKLEECCQSCNQGGKECCCKKLKDKLASGLSKLLLLECKCSCTTTTGADNELKVRCVFFNNPWGSSSVAVLVFCKCAQAAKPCCCLTTLIQKFKDKVSKKICTENQCVCEDLKDCKDLCCTEGCPAGCVCTTLKGKLTEICNGKGNCGDGKCLCQQLKDTVGKCIQKCTGSNPQCSTKDGSCRCPCCKVLGASIRLLTRACRSNILEQYKRIVTDLIGSDKNRPEIVRTIVNGINQSMVKKISLCKNYNSNVSSDNSITDISSVRNWGYDTLYQHSVTTFSGIRSDGYPNFLVQSFLTNSSFTHSVSTEFINFF